MSFSSSLAHIEENLQDQFVQEALTQVISPSSIISRRKSLLLGYRSSAIFRADRRKITSA